MQFQVYYFCLTQCSKGPVFGLFFLKINLKYIGMCLDCPEVEPEAGILMQVICEGGDFRSHK